MKKIYEVIYLKNEETKSGLFIGETVQKIKKEILSQGDTTILAYVNRTPKIDILKLQDILKANNYRDIEISFILSNLI